MDKTMTYEPAPCKGDKALFKGQVVLTVPSYEERMEIMLDTDMMAVADQGEAADKSQSMKMMLGMVKASYKFYQKVDIVHKESKTAFKSVDDMRYSPACAGILSDVATYLLKADGLGKT